MSLFLLNILLAVGFMVMAGTYSMSGLAAGLIVGYAALWVTRPLYGNQRYFARLPKAIKLILFFIKELILSNLRVLWDVVTPAHISRPGIIGIPLDARTDLEIMLVANLISLTPGTLSVDLSPDRRTLYVHVMFLDDIENMRNALKDGLERRVLEVLR
jgi:multicomponent Na+:H+ antiporter subunit E